jgi:MHS family proline/betaine transporter-like MFS transporter
MKLFPLFIKPTKKLNKRILAAIIGNFFEYYEYSIYIFLVPTIGHLFFTPLSTFNQLIALATFSIALVARPLGGYFLGKVGDKNKEKALYISILLSGISTLSIGCLPTYTTLGVIAPILLLVCRLLQSFSLGGEFCTALLYVMHATPDNRKSLYTALLISAGTLGWGVGAWTVTFDWVYNTYYGWRLLFIAGGSLGIIGALWRYSLLRTNSNFVQITINEPINFCKYKLPAITTFILAGLNGCLFYSLLIFPKLLLEDFFRINNTFLTRLLPIFAMVSYGIMTMIIGYVLNIYKSFSCLYRSLLLLIMCILPIYWSICSQHFGLILIASFIGSIFTGAIMIASCTVIYQLFYTSLNVSGISLFYNLGSCILGGSTPFVLSILTTSVENPLFIALYVFVQGITSLCFLFFVSKQISQIINLK